MAKKKYAMVALNVRADEADRIHVRRVLISFKDKKTDGIITKYFDTKFIAADPYFTSENATHKYIFEDDHYKLAKVENNPNSLWYIFKSEIYSERRYHSLPGPYKAIEFEASSKKAAIKQFNERKELR